MWCEGRQPSLAPLQVPRHGWEEALLVFPAQWCKCKSGTGGGLNFASEDDRAGGAQTRIHVRDCFMVTDHGTQLEKKGLKPGYWKDRMCILCKFNPRDI